MKKIPALNLEKILLFCGFTLALTAAGFWHLRQNVASADSMATFQQGVSTCFARVTQTFTAAMIRDMRSPYLNKDFMALSDECLRDGAKSASIDLSLMPKVGRLHNELVSEAHWFHEKVMKVLGTQSINSKDALPLSGVSEKYSKIEGLKLDLADQVDINLGQVRAARLRDELLMGTAFCLFMAALTLLAFRQARSMRALREIERQALSLLNTGNANVGAMVDQLLGRALNVAQLPITLRVFRDYHGDVMETLTDTIKPSADLPTAPMTAAIVADKEFEDEPATITVEEPIEAAGVSGVEARKLLIAQATRLNISMEVEDGMVIADEETVSQIIQAMGQRYAGWNAQLKGNVENHHYVIRLQADGVCLNSSELEYCSRVGAHHEGVDVNIVMAVDLAREEGLVFRAANRMGPDGSIVGSEAVIELMMVPNKNLKTIVRGKKRDIEKQIRNFLN